MTREEKINLLKAIIQECEEYQWWRKATLSEIIEDLEQEPSEDCIARQPLIDNWNSCADMLMGEGDSEVVMGWIFDAPPVTPVRKAGKWTPGEPICPCCGENKFKDLDADIWTDWRPKYCPNCGAKMEFSEDDFC